MDIKDLNKFQLLLLAVLLSFVTSIATGITTVTLMQQAPASFTAPVSRVIKQTVEKIQQVEGKTTVQTVVVKEEDLVVDAIAKNSSSIFVISKDVVDVNTGQNIEVSAGRGFVVSNNNIIVADGGLVPGPGSYYVKNDSGKFRADFLTIDKAGFSFLKIGAPLNEKDEPAFTLPTFGDFSKMKAGQSVIIVGNPINSSIFNGKDVNVGGAIGNAGALISNLDGDVVGIALSGTGTTFAPISTVTEALKAVDNAN